MSTLVPSLARRACTVLTGVALLFAAACATPPADEPAPATGSAASAAPAPAVEPTPPPPPPAPAVTLGQTGSFVVTTELLSGTRVNDAWVYRISVTAVSDLLDVEVEDTLPSGLEYVSSDPEAEVDEGDEGEIEVAWEADELAAGETWSITLTVMPTAEGSYALAPEVEASVVSPIDFEVFAPSLTAEIVGQPFVELGREASWAVRIVNEGEVAAPEVTLTADVPEGMTPVDPWETTLEEVPAGATRMVLLRATVDQKGDYTIPVTVSFPGEFESVTASTAFRAGERKLSVAQTGPAQAFLDQETPYTVRVTNSGDERLRKAEVTVLFPAELQVIDTAGGDSGIPGQLQWTLDGFEAGDSETFTPVLQAAAPLTGNVSVQVTSVEGLSETASTETRWIPLPEIDLNLIQGEGEAVVGQRVTFVLLINATGEFAPLTTQLRVTTSENVRTGTVFGADSRFEGDVVVVPALTLTPDAPIELTMRTEMLAAGPATVEVALSSEVLDAPVTHTEEFTITVPEE